MKSQLSSDHGHGLFVSVDGPSGAGKTTIVRHLAQMLLAEDEQIHLTEQSAAIIRDQLANLLAPSEVLSR